MTSQINTNGINVNYPVPGQNNSSQGFRDNFAQIRTQLNTGASEITDLQSKVVLKAALNNSTLNNDMANTLISNASTSGFRATTYNLGNALAGTVVVDVNRADVHFGAVQGNVVLQFGNWAPTNTQSNVVVRLTFANTSPAYISLPSNCINSNNDFGVTLLENYANVNGVATISAPANANILELRFSSIDCGNTVTVEPINRPYQATQVVTRQIPPTGLPGDVSGDIAVGTSLLQGEVTSTIGTGNYIVIDDTTGYYPDMPVVFTGNTDASNSNIVAGTTYYVNAVANSTAFTVSATPGDAQFEVGTSSQSFNANPGSYVYICTNSYNSNSYSKTVTNTYASGNVIKLSGTANLAVDAPVVFTGNVFGGLVSNVVYYVKTIDSGNSNITVAYSRSNGIAGTTAAVSTANGSATLTCYVEGDDIWKRVELKPW
jgi:hypothetical protein